MYESQGVLPEGREQHVREKTPGCVEESAQGEQSATQQAPMTFTEAASIFE